jgi:uncharacterized protein (TIGR00661 family)
MKKRIFYSLAGEGLGHAIRTTAILEHLDPEFEVHLFTWGEAYDFFKKRQYPFLHRIAKLPFGRTKNNKISTSKSILNFVKFCINFPSSFRYIGRLCKTLDPVLCIADFEAIMPRIAYTYYVPLFSIDNQHKFSRCESKDLPRSLRIYAYLMGLFTEIYVPRPERVIVSTFHHNALKKTDDQTIITNCFVRKSFNNYQPTIGDYVLLYYKSPFGGILEILAQTNWKIKVYGCPPHLRTVGKFEYQDIDNERFIKDLAGCSHLICGAGNQLLGEAIYYGKPIFAIPEPNQPEQSINAFYVEKMKRGTSCDVENLSIDKFLNFYETFKSEEGVGINGAIEAVTEIHKYLGVQ